MCLSEEGDNFANSLFLPTSCTLLLIKYSGHDTIYFAEDSSMKERRRKPFRTIWMPWSYKTAI